MDSEHYYTSGTVAEALGIPRWQLAYLIERRIVPDASFQVPGRRLFTEEDINRIRQALAERAKSTCK
ncbi:MAG: MerR family transcriptional regulator [Gemmataceae bacterium]